MQDPTKVEVLLKEASFLFVVCVDKVFRPHLPYFIEPAAFYAEGEITSLMIFDTT